MKRILSGIYKKLYNTFGPQAWWPGDTAFEIIVGAILTQNTAWVNVEKAIKNLKENNLLSSKALSRTKTSRIARLIKPSGYYNIKAKRLKNFLNFLSTKFNGNLNRLFKTDLLVLRQALLEVKGIGPETADSILLYAANKPIFVIDAYTKRIFSRHGLVNEDAAYDDLQQFFMSNLPKDARLYNEYHALIVKVGKDLCRKRPKCDLCPLKDK